MHPSVSIFMAVHNGASWLKDVLDSVAMQTYPAITLTVWDNASTDDTAAIIRRYPQAHYEYHDTNDGFWAAMEKLIARTNTPYVICLTDVVLDPGFVAESIKAMETDPQIGAVQGKIYAQHRAPDGSWNRTTRIDALGFRLQRSRRITILGHGEYDTGQYAAPQDIFGVEGAVPVFRRAALAACALPDASLPSGTFCVTDPAYRVGGITYADDVDLGWRMTLMGWKQVMIPAAIGWHDRSTTKGTAARPIIDQILRTAQRQSLPIQKRRLDWSNIRFSIIKNDSIINILRDLPHIIIREVAVAGYTFLFEPAVFKEAWRFFRLLPTMLRRRREVQARARMAAAQMRTWIT
jgi:GT2 family glycosyltransferase